MMKFIPELENATFPAINKLYCNERRTPIARHQKAMDRVSRIVQDVAQKNIFLRKILSPKRANRGWRVLDCGNTTVYQTLTQGPLMIRFLKCLQM